MEEKIPVGLKIAIINRMFKKKLDGKAKEMGLTSSQLRVLGTISHFEDKGGREIHQNDLERFERVSHPAMTKMLQRLESKGLITCKKCMKDKRYKIISCTDKSEGMHKKIIGHDRMVFDEMCRNLTGGEKKMVEDCIDMLFSVADADVHEEI